ncbi:MAG: hypothetical protein J7575_03780 [Chloroflexi bacterium]|jgi:hypothetical protein|nr:hypothetical protein [Chloroflexota bacterium]
MKRQRKALKKRAERQKARAETSSLSSPSPSRSAIRRTIREAGQWPLLECLIPEEWQDTKNILQIVVARRSPQGQVAAGVFLVDLACLGVKDGFPAVFSSQREYEQRLRRRVTERQKVIRADLNLAAKIIREAAEYAARLGFRVHPDAVEAMPILGDANPDACEVPIPLGGPGGKPMYIAGPYDDVQSIMNHLLRTLGPDGFHYLVPLEGLGEDWDE